MTKPSFDVAMFELLHEHTGAETFQDMARTLAEAAARYQAMAAAAGELDQPQEHRGSLDDLHD